MSSDLKLPSEVEFASFLVYNPSKSRFPAALADRSRRIMRAVKGETSQWMQRNEVAEYFSNHTTKGIRERFLGSDTTLVPMPGHAPLRDPASSHWASREICRELVRCGLGARWSPLLERRTAVAKSSMLSRDDRKMLTARVHFESLAAEADIGAGSQITLVDDVVTRGTTLLAGVARLQGVYPGATVRGFAFIRAMSSDAIEAIISQCEGTISLHEWGTKRIP